MTISSNRLMELVGFYQSYGYVDALDLSLRSRNMYKRCIKSPLVFKFAYLVGSIEPLCGDFERAERSYALAARTSYSSLVSLSCATGVRVSSSADSFQLVTLLINLRAMFCEKFIFIRGKLILAGSNTSDLLQRCSFPGISSCVVSTIRETPNDRM